MALSAYQDLDEYFTELENHWGGYDAYRARFLRPTRQKTELPIWQHSISFLKKKPG